MSTGLDGVTIPSEWSWVPLSTVTTVLRRGTAPEYVDEGALRVVGQASNQDSGIDWERARFHEFKGDARKLKGYLVERDVIVNSTGTGTLGRVGHFLGAPDSLPCIADSHVTVVRPNPEILNSRYLYYYLSSAPYQHYMMSALVTGATNQIELSPDRMGSSSISLPGLEEQRRIADFLDVETSYLDGISKKRLRQLQLVRSRTYSVMEEELGPLFDNAPSVRLSSLFCETDVRLGAASPPVLLSVSIHFGVAPYDEINDRPPRADGFDSYKVCRRGDLILNRMRAFQGAVGISRQGGIVSPDYAVLRPQKGVDPKFLHYLFRSPRVISGMSSVIRGIGSEEQGNVRTPRVNVSDLKYICVPDLNQDCQFAIASRLEHSTEDQDRLVHSISRQVELLAERRQTLVTAAVTGELDVTTARSGVRA
ncbi:restriction endonuclease subunit S [Amycolatopsis sp. NPDC051372]|uniref:restriction endonuclease subunit S n=1 Tax=Amycolatopsis sp. NPDC051372 TaxID=3155669 RepID=UPI003429732C